MLLFHYRCIGQLIDISRFWNFLMLIFVFSFALAFYKVKDNWSVSVIVCGCPIFHWCQVLRKFCDSDRKQLKASVWFEANLWFEHTVKMAWLFCRIKRAAQFELLAQNWPWSWGHALGSGRICFHISRPSRRFTRRFVLWQHLRKKSPSWAAAGRRHCNMHDIMLPCAVCLICS